MSKNAEPVFKEKKRSIWTPGQIVLMIVILIFSLTCLLPFVNVAAISFSSKSAILRGDVSFWPVEFNTTAYQAIFSDSSMIRSLVYTVIITVIYTVFSMILTILMAYPLTKGRLRGRKFFNFLALFTMYFSGGTIPIYLNIKELGLLNTFAALILPTMANGYNIFLLKGFFDSLPKELFESAAIDGASEWVVFWHIAMGLSTPILSVIALSSFTHAYGNFMMAFLLCQDQSMWTMMVYLYQLQQRASQAVGFSALIIAAIPTLLVFIFCQNIIIKGIVVPTEK